MSRTLTTSTFLLFALGLPSLVWSAPSLNIATPSAGPAGTVLTLKGNGLDEVTQVLICGQEAELLSVAETEVSVRVPEGDGVCSIEVRAKSGENAKLAAVFRYVAFEHDEEETKVAVDIEFRGEDQVVTGTRIPRRISDAPVLTEVIDADRIEAKGAVCLVDALTYEPGVRIDNMCSICNTTGIKLSGMPAAYTMLLVDGVPTYSSLGQTYGWLMLSAADIERIEIIRGANSILYGTDAMGGVVNVITKAPTERASAQLNLEAGAFGYHYLTGNAGVRRGPWSLSLTSSHTAHGSIDRDGDEVSEFAGYKRGNLSAAVRYDRQAVDVLTRVSATQEARQGGGMGSIIEVLDDADRRGFSETILTQRLEASSVIDVHVNDDLDLETTLSVVHHHQDSDYEQEVYVGKQFMVFGQEAAVAKLHQRYSIVGGIAYRGEFLEENLALSDYKYHLAGVFVQGDWLPDPRVELLHGIRYDFHNVFGHIVTPRVSLRGNPVPELTLRLTSGTGFRAPTTFYEYAHGVRPEGYKLVMSADNPETSINTNLSAQLDLGRKFRATVEGGYNRVKNPITVEATADGNVEVFNADGVLTIVSTEVQLQSSPVEPLFLTAGYGHYIYDDPAGAVVSAPPADVIDFSVDVSLDFGLLVAVATTITGPMDLRSVYGLAYNGHDKMKITDWLDVANADLNSAKLEMSPWQATLDARVQQEFKGGISLYVGAKNLLDYHQSDVEGPLMFPDEDGAAG
ncbi:MAG: TonB-dependent receptor, partial [Proteobacteria bacterium]|nr:TonB-dependent receptor [Pseudomonadota bacterium]